jgi:sugar lactone lactonase YvrE
VSLLSEAVPVAAVLARPHTLLEGPRIAPGGELLYSDVLAGGVFSCSPEGVVSEILARRRGVGGILPHADGGWVLSGRTLLHLAPGGEQRELYAEEDACGFNDLGSTPAGGLLAGVLRYRPMAGEEPVPGRLLLLEPGGGRRVLSEEVTWPNGIGVAPDGNTVYLSDYASGRVLATSLDGAPTREFARVPRGSADGLAVDAEGGVWVALGDGGGVARFAGDGSLDEVVELPAGFVSSLSFGGSDLREVLITTADNREDPERGGTLLRARSEVAGAVVYPVAL